MASEHMHDHDTEHDLGHDHQPKAATCCAGNSSAETVPELARGRSFKVRGMDCADEVAVLKQAVGPLVGGAERLAFDVLNGKMTVSEAAKTVPNQDIVRAIAATGMSAVAWDKGMHNARLIGMAPVPHRRCISAR